MVVMPDEQMEVLRKQIFIYFTICEQLVGMHRTLTSHQDSIAGMRLGNLYCDPLMVHGGHKITARQRWAPTQMQLQILESIFDQGNGTPRKQKIKDITAELSPAISQRLMSTTGSRTGVHGRSGRSLLSYQITLNWRLRRMRSPRPRRSPGQMDHFTRTFGRSFTSY